MPDKSKIGYRPTWAEVNLNNLEHNFRQIKSRLLPSTKILVTVKADAYGHGLIPVSRRLVSCGADFLGVASIDEGIKLRREKIKCPILILGVVLKKDLKPLLRYKLMPTVCDESFAVSLSREAAKRKELCKVHVKVDTGMGRIGVLHEDAFSLVKRIHRLPYIRLEGIFTHFPFADINRKFTVYQIRLFNRLNARLKNAGIRIPLVHAANSMGVIDYKDSHFTMVRPGLVIYGLYPRDGLNIKLKPALALKSRIVFIKKVPPGYGISYGHAYITKKSSYIATLPIGYGDGYPRNLSNLSPVLIGSRRFKVSGRICMDQMMVDVGKFTPRIGQEATLIGRQGKFNIRTEELADLAGTIPYEIVCGLGSRIPRVYIP